MDRAEEIRQVRQALSDYLHLHGLRSTPERFALLEAIYMTDGIFKPEKLLADMEARKTLRVCRATVYNNLGLFEDAGLVRKLMLNGESGYEKLWHNPFGIRLVCTSCGRVTECGDEKVRHQIEDMKKKRFTMTGWSLNLYGLCSKCQAALKRKQKKLLDKTQK